MPIYEYQCSTCQHQLEAFQSLHDAPLKDCPECGKATLTKLISASQFQLKGSGWYATDYAKAKPQTETTTSKDESTSGGDTTAESKTKDIKDTNTSSNSGTASS